MRDPDKSATYAAEQQLCEVLDLDAPLIELCGAMVPTPEERKFADIASIQRYVDLVLERRGRAPGSVRVVARRGDKHAALHFITSSGVPEMRIPAKRVDGRYWAMRELVVLHELAHFLSFTSVHSTRFRAEFLRLVQECMGSIAAGLLAWYFELNEVDIVQMAR